MVVLAQSKEAWYTLEFQAACLEAKHKIESEGLRYLVRDKIAYIERQVRSVQRFDAECRILKRKNKEERGFPTWETICEWEKENPNLPGQVRERGFLGGFRAQQFTGPDRVSGERIPVYSTGYSPQSQPYVSSNDVVSQACGFACQLAVLTFAGWCAGQCVKAMGALAPFPKREHT